MLLIATGPCHVSTDCNRTLSRVYWLQQDLVTCLLIVTGRCHVSTNCNRTLSRVYWLQQDLVMCLLIATGRCHVSTDCNRTLSRVYWLQQDLVMCLLIATGPCHMSTDCNRTLSRVYWWQQDLVTCLLIIFCFVRLKPKLQAMNECNVIRVTAPLIFNLWTSWQWAVYLNLWQIYPRNRTSVSTEQEAGWPLCLPARFERYKNFYPYRDSNPGWSNP
jgi:hypothetical protein